MPKNKHRWKKIRSAVVNPRKFYYVGLPDGRTEVYRGYNAFDWGPIDVDRDDLRRLLGILNGLKGDSIERVGRKLCNDFKREYDEGKHRPKYRMNPAKLRIGKRVISNAEFSGVAKKTIGEIVEASNSWPENESVAVKWNRFEGDTLIDWFSFDDLKYLDEVVGL